MGSLHVEKFSPLGEGVRPRARSMNMEPRVSVGLIALGEHMVRGHADHLEKVGGEIAAVFDPSQEAVDRFRSSRGEHIQSFSTEEALLSSSIEAVLISSPDRFHAESCLRAVMAGKHVMVEKPMAHSLSALPVFREALRVAEKKGLVITSCHPRRYDRPYIWLKSAIQKWGEQLGPAMELRLDFSYHKPSKQGLHTGLLADHANHEFDLMHFLFEHSSFKAMKLIDEEDRYHVSGIREDGMVFNFSGTRRLDSKTYQENAILRFERGEIIADAHFGNALVVIRDEDRIVHDHCGTTDYEGRFEGINRNFIDVIRGRSTPYLTRDDLIVNTEASVILTDSSTYEYRVVP